MYMMSIDIVIVYLNVFIYQTIFFGRGNYSSNSLIDCLIDDNISDTTSFWTRAPVLFFFLVNRTPHWTIVFWMLNLL